MSQPDPRALIERYFEAIAAGDHDAVLACVADDIVHDINQGGERRHGKDRYHAFLARMSHHYSETLSDIVILVSEDGTRAAAEYNAAGKYLNTEDGLPPADGQTYALPGATFFAVRDGLITRITQYYNLTDWITQITAPSDHPARH